jgi:hypothetical protein
MQVLTELPFGLRRPPTPLSQSPADRPAACEEPDSTDPTALPLWPDYFARRGREDALTWQYKGYWGDTARLWRNYYRFVVKHPVVAFHGLRQFYAALTYRVLGEAIGDRSSLPIAAATPLLLALTPVLSAIAVAIASIPGLKARTPMLFQPFNRKGWSNYCIMLSLVFALHGFRQHQRKTHPAKLSQHSAKTFWNGFFTAELPAGHYPTRLEASCIKQRFSGKLPPCDVIVKPDTAGAGHRLHLLRWDATTGLYAIDRAAGASNELGKLTREELQDWLCRQPLDMIVERAERPRAPLPVCTLRILTLFSGPRPELICAVFIKAPNNSISTALFDTDVYLFDHETCTIGAPLATDSNGALTGSALPEMQSVIDNCLRLHARLPDHVQISWDVIPTARGPVYLEGNVFPPGCDYKLTVFKDDANFELLTRKILGRSGLSYSGTELMR